MASGAGILLLLGQLPEKQPLPKTLIVVGVFGLLVTLGLFTYELRGIQRCNALIEVGKALENELVVQGQFRLRPGAVNGTIGTTLAARIIYPAVLAAWLFVAQYGSLPRWLVMVCATVLFIVGVAGSFSLRLEVILDDLKKKDKERHTGTTD